MEEIKKVVSKEPSIACLWSWEGLVKRSAVSVCDDLTSLAHKVGAEVSVEKLEDRLRVTLQLMAEATAEGALSATTAPGHMVATLSQLLLDHVEHSRYPDGLLTQGGWLAAGTTNVANQRYGPSLNTLLLTAEVRHGSKRLLPGTVYAVQSEQGFKNLFGASVESLIEATYKGSQVNGDRWRQQVKAVVVEISPDCDVAQGNRYRALLIGGLIVSSDRVKECHSQGGWNRLPIFRLRSAQGNCAVQDVFLVCCSRYRATIALNGRDWLRPWFRLREMPVAELRNWHAAQAARVGVVSV